VIEVELTVTAPVPLDVNVTDFVTDVPTATLPNASELVLAVNADVTAFSCSETLREAEPPVAVIDAVCEAFTGATVAVKFAVVAPAPTVTLPGTVTAPLLLASVTPNPPVNAAELRVTVQVVVPEPVNVVLPQESALTDGVVTELNAPFSLIEADFETDPCVAVNVTVCAVVTAEALATKLALEAPAATVTDAGTVNALLLLDRPTARPVLGAAELNPTVQLSVPAPVIEVLAQATLESVTDLLPLPCSFTVLDTVVSVLVIAVTVS
jgi:hypothetical protein